jgi:arylsulfatase A-like enzyme
MGLAVGCLAAIGCSTPGDGGKARPPNVVVVLVDDLGVEGLSCYGGESYATPHLDALAGSGMRFTAAHTTPLCTPSRVRLLTGREGLRSYVDFSVLDRDERTFAHLLGDAGYATGVAGKWQLFGARHYGERAGRGTRPEDAGFDTWCLWQVEELGSRYADPTVEVDGELRILEEAYGPEVFCDWALEFVRDHRDEPFLLFLPMALTHDPFEPTPLSDHDGDDRSRTFGDMVAYTDLVVGRLVDELERLGLRERTLLVFTTDNGSPRQITSRLDGREIRGGKGRTTDSGTHVPLIVSWPDVIPPGVCDDLVDLVDVLPTVVEATGATLPDDRVIDGRSLLPRLRGGEERAREVLTCWYLPRPLREGAAEVRWARDARYKLYGDGRLYDLETDRSEEHPLDLRLLHLAETRQRLEAALQSLPATPAKLARRE